MLLLSFYNLQNLFSQSFHNNYIFKQVMPISQWMDYSPDKTERAVILDSEGGAIIISQTLGPWWLIMQKIDRFGNVIWSDHGTARKLIDNMSDSDAGFSPILVSDNKGGAYVAYAYAEFKENQGNWWYNYDVYVQHISNEFERSWGKRGIVVADNDSIIYEYPYGLIQDGKNGLLILYSGHSFGQGPYGTKYLQSIDANGEILWSDLGIMLTTNDTTGIIHIIPDNNKGAILFGMNNYGQRINHKGEFLWQLPFVKTGLPKCSRIWFFRELEQNIPTVTIVGDNVCAQKISEIDGSLFWGENGKLWEPAKEEIYSPPIITKNGNGGAYIFFNHFLQEMDEQGNFLYEIPKTVIDTTQYGDDLFPVSGEYAEGLGAYVLYADSKSYNEGKLILQRITDDGYLPWGMKGITLCDANSFLNQSHSLIKVDDQFSEAFVFVEFLDGIFVTKVELITGENITQVYREKKGPIDFYLSVYPNPFVHSTKMKITGIVRRHSPVNLYIYNILGKEVINLTNKLLSNRQYVFWDGCDSLNNNVVPGIYFVKLEIDHKVHVHKMIKLN